MATEVVGGGGGGVWTGRERGRGGVWGVGG